MDDLDLYIAHLPEEERKEIEHMEIERMGIELDKVTAVTRGGPPVVRQVLITTKHADGVTDVLSVAPTSVTLEADGQLVAEVYLEDK